MSTTFCETGIVRIRVDIVQRYFEIRLCSRFNFMFLERIYFKIHMRTFTRPPNWPPPTVTVSNDVHDIDSDFGEGAKKNPFNYISG